MHRKIVGFSHNVLAKDSKALKQDDRLYSPEKLESYWSIGDVTKT